MYSGEGFNGLAKLLPLQFTIQYTGNQSNSYMANKLIIKKFGPINDLELEIKPFTILIGPQASGKSTVAKILAMCQDDLLIPTFNFINPYTTKYSILEKYNLQNFIKKDTYIEYINDSYSVKFIGNAEPELFLSESMQEYIYELARNNNIDSIVSRFLLEDGTEKSNNHSFEEVKNYVRRKKDEFDRDRDRFSPGLSTHSAFKNYQQIIESIVIDPKAVYIPTERILISSLSNALWSIIQGNIGLSQSITIFGSIYEKARNEIKNIGIDILGIRYSYENNKEVIIKGKKKLNLNESASGYQSTVPLFIVMEHLKKFTNTGFIIEEPELNLFPKAQKLLVQYLAKTHNSGINKKKEIFITTHSPYILSVINNLLYANKINKSNNNNIYDKLNKIIDSSCWIDNANLGAYYLESGKCTSIMDKELGLISENELDSVSEDIAHERDKLIAYYIKYKSGK